MISWPDIVTKNLWPYALRLAVDLHNKTPTSSGLTPEKIFTGISWFSHLRLFYFCVRPFLITRPQNSPLETSISCWCLSCFFSRTRLLCSSCLSTTTGLESPQLYVVFFYDNFSDGCLELTQTGLINKIVAVCGLQDQSTEHGTPATTILMADANGPPREHSWIYHSLIGMLSYLASSTCPEIAFAIHQCACFTTTSKCLHELAIGHIVRYLKGASDNGFLLWPLSTFNLDCFVDSDFAGTWSVTTSEDPSSVKPCT